MIDNDKKETPPVLYKYRAYSDRNIKMLHHNKIYFANPGKFNDPFDCAYNYIYKLHECEMIKQLISFITRRSLDNITEDELKKVQKIIEKNTLKTYKTTLENNILELKKICVFTLSERNDSMLMWSHYADSHKGFCIGYSGAIVDNPNDLHRVKYTPSDNGENLYMLHISSENPFEKAKEILLFTKHIDWGYEKEWRLLGARENNNCRLIQLIQRKKINGFCAQYDDSFIKEIIFGLNMPNPHRKRIIDITKNKNIIFKEVVRNPDSFGIIIKEI